MVNDKWLMVNDGGRRPESKPIQMLYAIRTAYL